MLLVTVPTVALPVVFAVTKLAIVVATATIIAVAILEVTVLTAVTEAVLVTATTVTMPRAEVFFATRAGFA